MTQEKEESFLGAGMKLPIDVNEVTGQFHMSYGEDNIEESIKVILLTGKGERVMRPDFGSNLNRFVFESIDYGNLVQIENEVKDALRQWEPRITDVEAEARQKEGSGNMIEIHISYRVRITNNPYNMVFPFYLEEGYDS